MTSISEHLYTHSEYEVLVELAKTLGFKIIAECGCAYLVSIEGGQESDKIIFEFRDLRYFLDGVAYQRRIDADRVTKGG